MLQGNITPKDVLNGQINGLEKIRGYSAYEVACINGFKGTEAEWLATLRGDPGYTPVRGIDYWTEDDQYAMRESVHPVIVTPAPDMSCDYTAGELYDIADNFVLGDTSKSVLLYWNRKDWYLPLTGFDSNMNACFERTMLNEEGKPVLVSFTIDKDGWLTRTDSNLPVIDDSKVGSAAWSSKNIVDKLCPAFTENGAIVTCEPVEGYPLMVTADELATTITRCGKNLFDKSESKLSRLSYKSTGGNIIEIFGFEFMLPPGTYVLKAQSKTSAKEGYIYGLTYDSSGKYTGEWNAAWGTDLNPKIKTFTDVTRVMIYDAVNTPANGAYMSYAWATFDKWNIQLEVGNTATAFEAYCGETFAPGDTIPALPGINTIFADTGVVAVTGRTHRIETADSLDTSVVKYTAQSLPTTAQAQARANIGAAAQADLAMLQNTILEKMCPTTTDNGAKVEITPVPGTAIGDIVTWIKSVPVNVVADNAWADFSNWEVSGEEGNYRLVYKFPMEAGDFNVKGFIADTADLGSIYISDVDEGGQATDEQFVYLYMGQTLDETGYFPDRFGTHTAALVVESCCKAQYVEALEIWHSADLGEYVDGSEITLTVTNGVETKTYNQTSGWNDFGAGMGYNWTTGQVLWVDGSILTDTEPGTPIEIIAESDVVSLETSIGMVEVNYKAYPAKVIEKLQNEIAALKKAAE